jgi:enterochelin esterase family protein
LPIAEPLTFEFPQGAYVEYAFLDADMHPIADSTNPDKPTNSWYDYHRCFALPQNRFTTPPRLNILRGILNKLVVDSHILATQRTYYVYEPPLSPVATVYVHDGEAFYAQLHFHEVVDALIEQGAIQPVRLIMIEPQDRKQEYWFNERYEAFLLEEIRPEIVKRYGETSEEVQWGASLGGLVSAWLAWRNPHVFTKVASQSGCFTADLLGGNYYHDREWLTEQFANSSHRPLRFFLQTGQLEWLLAPNRRFAAMLADKGYKHSYQELPGGHNWATWEQGLVPGLIYLFGSDM